MRTDSTNYALRILDVQRYIQRELDGDLSLEVLAEVAGYSTYHFHRIFRGQVGESTGDYVRRLRLERAAQTLRYKPASVLEVAIAAGYASHEAFTRAFGRMFGVSPSEYQTMDHFPSARKAEWMTTVTHQLPDVRLEEFPVRRIAGLRVVGKYCNATMGPAFGRIQAWAEEQGVLNDQSLFLGVYHDDPEVTAPEKLRADAAVTVDETVRPTGEVQLQLLPGGTYAVLRHRGHYDLLEQSYGWLYGVWLPQSGRVPADSPPYEIYVNECTGLPPEEWLTDVCLPLAPRG
jgi:AraC family transcriptional regulator